ncbi:MAG TPA: ATP-binding protein [Armatimonadota bacterium]|jgi:anti-sigma regulatory factor (Ser/Thr protein kinase)
MPKEQPPERVSPSHPLDAIAPRFARESLANLLSQHREALTAEWRREQDKFLYSAGAPAGADIVDFGFDACLELLASGCLARSGNFLTRFRAPGETPAHTAARLHHVFSTMCHSLTPVVVDAWGDDPERLRQAIALLLGAMDIGVAEVCSALELAVSKRDRDASEYHLHCLEELARHVTRDSLRLVAAGSVPPSQGQRIAICHASDAAFIRRAVVTTAREIEMAQPRVEDLSLAVGEAVSNVIRHAGVGTAHVWRTDNTVFVRVDDNGRGIAVENLPNVVSPGWSSEYSLGMGFTLMLEMSDTLWLASGPEGTSICIEKWTFGRPMYDAGASHPATVRYLA